MILRSNAIAGLLALGTVACGGDSQPDNSVARFGPEPVSQERSKPSPSKSALQNPAARVGAQELARNGSSAELPVFVFPKVEGPEPEGVYSEMYISEGEEETFQEDFEVVDESVSVDTKPPQGMPTLGPNREWLSIPVQLEVTRDYLEFLLVNPIGAVHESLLSTQVDPLVLNASLLGMGLEPGRNVSWEAIIPDAFDPATLGQQGRPQGTLPQRDQYRVIPPHGDSLYLYVAWKEGTEIFFFRLEDLVRDLDRSRTLRRHKFVYLGSFMTEDLRTGEARFAASLEGNLINTAFFRKGATLFTTAVEECDKQANWLANSWLLPERGSAMTLMFSKQLLVAPPKLILDNLTVLPAQEPEPEEDRSR